MTVDRGRRAVYDAENSAFIDTLLAEPVGFDAACDFLDAVCASPAWAALGARVPDVEATRSDSSTSQAVDGRLVRLAPGGCSPHVVVHELAHIAAARVLGDPAGHGPEWRGLYLWLVDAVFGSVHAGDLTAAFARFALPVTPYLPPHAGDAAPSGGVWLAWERSRMRVSLGRPGRAGPSQAPIAL